MCSNRLHLIKNVQLVHKRGLKAAKHLFSIHNKKLKFAEISSNCRTGSNVVDHGEVAVEESEIQQLVFNLRLLPSWTTFLMWQLTHEDLLFFIISEVSRSQSCLSYSFKCFHCVRIPPVGPKGISPFSCSFLLSNMTEIGAQCCSVYRECQS